MHARCFRSFTRRLPKADMFVLLSSSHRVILDHASILNRMRARSSILSISAFTYALHVVLRFKRVCGMTHPHHTRRFKIWHDFPSAWLSSEARTCSRLASVSTAERDDDKEQYVARILLVERCKQSVAMGHAI
eukprot:6199971-Pleurochrysis_carterae.AAC.2